MSEKKKNVRCFADRLWAESTLLRMRQIYVMGSGDVMHTYLNILSKTSDSKCVLVVALLLFQFSQALLAAGKFTPVLIIQFHWLLLPFSYVSSLMCFQDSLEVSAIVVKWRWTGTFCHTSHWEVILFPPPWFWVGCDLFSAAECSGSGVVGWLR